MAVHRIGSSQRFLVIKIRRGHWQQSPPPVLHTTRPVPIRGSRHISNVRISGGARTRTVNYSNCCKVSADGGCHGPKGVARAPQRKGHGTQPEELRPMPRNELSYPLRPQRPTGRPLPRVMAGRCPAGWARRSWPPRHRPAPLPRPRPHACGQVPSTRAPHQALIPPWPGRAP